MSNQPRYSFGHLTSNCLDHFYSLKAIIWKELVWVQACKYTHETHTLVARWEWESKESGYKRPIHWVVDYHLWWRSELWILVLWHRSQPATLHFKLNGSFIMILIMRLLFLHDIHILQYLIWVIWYISRIFNTTSDKPVYAGATSGICMM